MDEYCCLILLSRPAEAEAAFKARLSDLWTRMLRQHDVVFEKVYAEASTFEKNDNRLSRKYLVEAAAIDELTAVLQRADMDFEAVDREDIYSKFEAAPPDWFWIEH